MGLVRYLILLQQLFRKFFWFPASLTGLKYMSQEATFGRPAKAVWLTDSTVCYSLRYKELQIWRLLSKIENFLFYLSVALEADPS